MITAFLGYTQEEFEKYFSQEDIASIKDNIITLKDGSTFVNISQEWQLKGEYSQYDAVVDKDNLRKRFYMLYLKHTF